MKNYNKLIFTLIGTTFLVGCNSKASADLKAIAKDGDAITIAKSIYNRQTSTYPIVFTEPNNFVVKNTITDTNDELTTEKAKGKSAVTNEFYCDINNFMAKNINKTVNENENGKSESEVETIHYYDKSTGIYYILTNTNGLKTKKITYDVSLSKATTSLKNLRAPYLINIKNQDFLSDMENTIKEMQEKKKEQYKEGEYFNYYLGSNDDKSLQLKNELKLQEEEASATYQLTGYTLESANMIMRDDKSSYACYSSEVDIKDKDGNYYRKNSHKDVTEYSYGDASIKISGINDYIVVNQ